MEAIIMGLYKHVREAWKKPRESLRDLWKQRLVQWRQEPVTLRILRPTRIDRARSLGYKAKPGYIIIRQRVERGGRMRPKITGGRRSKHARRRKVLSLSYQSVAEQRAVKNYKNCEVLNSYWVGEDGNYYWYEVILVDRAHPQILADTRINWILNQRGRVNRGLTSAGKKSRGLGGKGKGYEKMRPSKRANWKRRKG